MGKKAKYKAAKKAAEFLPVVMQASHENHIENGWQMIARGETEINGKPVNPNEVYVNPLPVSMAINHKRRMKKLVNQYGNDIIPVYEEAINQSAK